VTLDLTCTECEASFEIDVQELADDPKTLVCPNCDAKAPARKVTALATALEDLITAMEDLASKFEIHLAAETDDLPAEEERPSSLHKDEEESEEVDEETEEDEDEDELEFGD
jgi:predicted nucleic acid-binding Zn ribbon protein